MLKDENEFDRHFEVSAEDELFCQEWHTFPPTSSSMIADNDTVVHTFAWFPGRIVLMGTQRVRHHSAPTRFLHMCPSMAGLQGLVIICYYPHYTKTGQERDNPWEEYVDGDDYIWENHVPSDVISTRDRKNCPWPLYWERIRRVVRCCIWSSWWCFCSFKWSSQYLHSGQEDIKVTR